MASFGKHVAYYRVSTARQGKSGLGIEAQRQAVATYLNGGDWRIVGEFTEVESGKRADRPELDKALAAARLHRCPLIVSKVDRLTRSVAFLSRLLEAGVDVRFADLPQIEGETGRFLLQQMVAVAELEAGMISKRTKDALAAAKRRGVKLGGDRGTKPSAKVRAKAIAAVEGARGGEGGSYTRPAQRHYGPSQPVSTNAASRPRVAKRMEREPGQARPRSDLTIARRRRAAGPDRSTGPNPPVSRTGSGRLPGRGQIGRDADVNEVPSRPGCFCDFSPKIFWKF
jgi:DNA invertase Pin-like site-specific DNA recombinase